MASAKAETGEVYTTQIHDGQWCACLVIRAEASEIELLALDWTGEEPPHIDQLQDIDGLLVEEAGDLIPCRINAGPVPPWRFELVGRRERIPSFERRCTSWSGWGAIPYQVHAWWHWNHQVPEEVRATRREQHRRRGKKIALEIDGKVRMLDESTWRLWLGPEDLRGIAHQIRINPEHQIDWERFEPLSNLSEVHYTGRDPAFLDFLRSRPFVTRMLWRESGQQKIDLSGTWLEGISVEVGQGPLELVLPPMARSLSLLALEGSPAIRVRDPRDGWGLWLSVRHHEIPRHIEGLEALRNLSAWGLEAADATRLKGFPMLQSVELRGAPGALRKATSLVDLKDLRELVLRDLYDLRTEEIPPPDAWPGLDTFECSGLRAQDAQALRKRLAGLRVLSIREAKSKVWVRANLENPFRDWLDDLPALGRKACAAYKKATRALSVLVDTDPTEARLHLEEFVATFNELDDTYELDAVRTEEVADAYDMLLEGCELDLDRDEAFRWFDDRRRLSVRAHDIDR